MGTNIFTCTGEGKMKDIKKKDSRNYSGGWYIFEYEDILKWIWNFSYFLNKVFL